jgi:hypothetical protein
MSLMKIKHAVRMLSLGQLRKLDKWLHELIRKAEESDRSQRVPPRKQVVEERVIQNETYRLEGIRCGKEKCKCARGQLHGPYWYSYMRIEGIVKSKYIGKKLPREVEVSIQLRE